MKWDDNAWSVRVCPYITTLRTPGPFELVRNYFTPTPQNTTTICIHHVQGNCVVVRKRQRFSPMHTHPSSCGGPPKLWDCNFKITTALHRTTSVPRRILRSLTCHDHRRPRFVAGKGQKRLGPLSRENSSQQVVVCRSNNAEQQKKLSS